jgi:hypothetical protein
MAGWQEAILFQMLRMYFALPVAQLSRTADLMRVLDTPLRSLLLVLYETAPK